MGVDIGYVEFSVVVCFLQRLELPFGVHGAEAFSGHVSALPPVCAKRREVISAGKSVSSVRAKVVTLSMLRGVQHERVEAGEKTIGLDTVKRSALTFVEGQQFRWAELVPNMSFEYRVQWTLATKLRS